MYKIGKQKGRKQ